MPGLLRKMFGTPQSSNGMIKKSVSTNDPVEQQINERMGVRAKLGALGGQLPLVGQMMQPQGQFNLNPSMSDPNGMQTALSQSGFTGQRMNDIQLPEDPQTVAQLKARIDRIARGLRY